jgi:signal transduction histidine kinase
MIQGPLEREEELDFLQRIRRETDRIYGIIRDLLHFARPSEQQNANATAGVEAAVTETLSLLKPQSAFRNVEVSTHVPADLPDVQISPEHLQQILLNLLINAAAACANNGKIHVVARHSETHVELRVEDNGPGVPAELRDRIFEPFVTTKEVGQGTGLGLSVCRGLVEAAGGSLLLDSTSSTGARFVILLPSASAQHLPDVGS